MNTIMLFVALAIVLAVAIFLFTIKNSGLVRHTGFRPGIKVDPANDAISTQEFQLDVSVDDGTTWVEVKQITEIPDPTGEGAFLDATNLKSKRKVYKAGLADSQNVNLTGQRVAADAGQNILRDNIGIDLKFRNTYPDGDILTYVAQVSKFGVTGGTDSIEMFTAVIRASGSEEWST